MNDFANKSQSKVSILMPSYNHERFVERAIESFCQQCYPNIELIIVDDCSTDGTYAKAVEKSKNWRNIKVFKNEVNVGISATLNRALDISSGHYIGFLASDDYYCNIFTQRCLEYFRSLPDGANACVHTNAYIIDEDDCVLGTFTEDLGMRPLEGSVFWDLITSERGRIVPSTLFLPRDLLIRVGGFDETLEAEDHDLHLRLSRLAEFHFIEEPLFYTRRHDSSLGRRPWVWADSTLRAVEKHASFIDKQYSNVMRRKAYSLSRSCFEAGSLYHGIRLYNKGRRHSKWRDSPSDLAFIVGAITQGCVRYAVIAIFPKIVVEYIRGIKRNLRNINRIKY